MLQDQLPSDLKKAQLDRDEVRVSTLRLLLSEIHNAQIQKGSQLEGLSDQEIVSVIQREVKKRKEAALGFRSGGREDQAQKEESELEILESYLPQQISNEELTKIVERSINEIGATSLNDMGKVMGIVMSKVNGQADGDTVSSMVKERLSK